MCAVEKMVKAIEEFDGLRALRLEGNTIGVEAAQTIAKALEKKSDLQVHVPDHRDLFPNPKHRSSHSQLSLEAAEKTSNEVPSHASK